MKKSRHGNGGRSGNGGRTGRNGKVGRHLKSSDTPKSPDTANSPDTPKSSDTSRSSDTAATSDTAKPAAAAQSDSNGNTGQPPGEQTPRIVLAARDIIKDLGEGAGQVRALKGVNLSLRAGELTLMMGPSGSGKTTLLSILGCILSPTEGEVLLGGESTQGKDAEELAVLRRNNIGFVFQSYNLFPTLSAEENVRIALDVRGDDPREAIAKSRDALKLVGLGHRMKSHPKHLSGGEQQRVAVARALAGEPSVILADEPTAALDSENGQSVMALLAEIAQDKSRAVLAVTHDPRTLPYADRIVRIEDGLIVSEERSNPSDVASVSDIRKRKRKAHV